MVELLRKSFAELGRDLISLAPRILLGLAILVTFLFLAKLIGKTVRKIMAKTSTEGHVDVLVARLVSISIIVVGAVAALGVMKINLTALMAGLGLTGFAIGFALKDLISNFLAGIVVLLQRPFTLGDQIKVQDLEGAVVNIRVRDTVVKTYDGKLAHIPNNIIFNSPIINYTAFPHRRISVIVAIGYDENIEKATQVCLETLSSIDSVLKDPAPEVLVSEFGESSINLEVRFWAESTRSNILQTKSAVTQRLRENLREANITIPFPIRTVLLKQKG